MDNIERPGILDIEKIFNQFVKLNGGNLVSELIANTDSLNADYSFLNPDLIVELKCLKKDSFSEEEDQQRIGELFDKWIELGYLGLNDMIEIIKGNASLPKQCIKELHERVEKSIDSILYKANKQIQETKIVLNRSNSAGMLFIANDGNYFYNHYQFISMIGDLLQRKYLDSEIDGFVYFTVNQTARLEGSDLDYTIWVSQYRNTENGPDIYDFIDSLQSKFYDEFLTSITKVPLANKILGGLDDIKDSIVKLKHVPKQIIYKKKKNK